MRGPFALFPKLLPISIALSGVLVAFMVAGVFPFSSAGALPPAGLDVFNVTAQVDASSRLGTEDISFSGTATIERGAPYMDDGVEVVDIELVGLELTGQSIVGDIVVTENPTVASPGELRSLSPGVEFPASSYIDAFVNVTIPSNPAPTTTLHNNLALRLLPTVGGEVVPLDTWPPVGVTYRLEPIFNFDNDGDTQVDEDTADDDGDGLVDEDRPGADPDTPGAGAECPAITGGPDCDGQEGEDPPADLCPPASDTGPTLCDQDGDGLIDEDPSCIPLLNVGNTHLKLGVCLRDIAITLGDAKTPTPIPTPTPGPPAAAGQTLSVAPAGPSGLPPAGLLEYDQGAGPVAVSGNNAFADAWPIIGLPFNGQQDTASFNSQAGEQTILPCITSPPNNITRTAWYRYTPFDLEDVTIYTEGSGFDTVVGVWTGPSLNSLVLIACDDDSGPLFNSELAFAAQPGTTYYIQAGGFDGAGGFLDLHVEVAEILGGPPTPPQRVDCAALGLTADGCDDGSDGDLDDVDAVAYGALFAPSDAEVAFSVAPGSLGLGATGVAAQSACTPAQPQADEFTSRADGTNSLLLDGDGLGEGCPTAGSVGLQELPESDDLDALEGFPPSFVDTNGDGALDETVFFSLATGSPSLAILTASPGAILKTTGESAATYATTTQLGLGIGDDLDALCVEDRGSLGTFEPGLDTVLFSLAAGSPSLGQLGLSAADVLRPGPEVAFSAATLGLRAQDDLDALACYDFQAPPPPTQTPTVSGPSATPTRTPTRTPTPGGTQNGDVNCNGNVDVIDAALILQFDAGMTATLPCLQVADVNHSGGIDVIDAALILQFDAGLTSGLP